MSRVNILVKEKNLMSNPYDPELWPIERPAESIYQETAWSLAGCKVLTRMRKPGRKDLIGEYKELIGLDGQRRKVIDLDPERSEGELYKTFLHECAHAVLHAKQLPIFPSDEEPASIEVPPELLEFEVATYGYQVREAEAENLSEAWRLAALKALGEDSSFRSRLEWLRDQAIDNPDLLNCSVS